MMEVVFQHTLSESSAMAIIENTLMYSVGYTCTTAIKFTQGHRFLICHEHSLFQNCLP